MLISIFSSEFRLVDVDELLLLMFNGCWFKLKFGQFVLLFFNELGLTYLTVGLKK